MHFCNDVIDLVGMPLCDALFLQKILQAKRSIPVSY